MQKSQRKTSSDRGNIVLYNKTGVKESNADVNMYDQQEGQHPLTGQRAPPISGGT